MLARLANKKAVSDSLKWLAVVCYGRLGFANSIFGRLNSHEVVSYLSRKMITRAKLIAERIGFDVHHLYVDSLFVSRGDATRDEFQALVKTIEQEMERKSNCISSFFLRKRFLRIKGKCSVGFG